MAEITAVIHTKKIFHIQAPIPWKLVSVFRPSESTSRFSKAQSTLRL